ncbi:MAG: hypothetical protein AB7P99_10150 [Vicinamibacterales bacterium]
MADRGYVRQNLGAFEGAQKVGLQTIFDYLLRTWRIGLPGHQKPAENMAWVQVDGVTASVANTEVAIAHGLGSAPRVAFPCLDLGTVGAQMVPLKVTRAADASRIYVSSSSTSAAFTLFIESR